MTSTANERLRPVDRLRSPKDFRRVNRTGKRTASAYLVAQIAPGRTPGHSGLGLVVSRRVGNAVARNQVKRRVREWFRRHREELPAGSDLVVIARPGSAALDGNAIARELSELVAR